jgi:chemotaxis protein CheZ
MAAPRRVFRIEQMAAERSEPQGDDAHAPRYGEIMHELGTLRAMLASAPAAAAAPVAQVAQGSLPQPDEIQRLTLELRLIHSALRGTPQPQSGNDAPAAAPAARIAGELQAVISDSELATQKILAAAEDIDQAANNLSVALKGDFEHGLAQDIRDRVIQIFEACNFQDLTSQRVAKVMATFAGLEHQIARALDELARAGATPRAQGPRLAGDRGHVSQSELDALFADEVASG